MTKEDKIQIIAETEEVLKATRMLAALMEEEGFENFVEIIYESNGFEFSLKLTKTVQSQKQESEKGEKTK